MEQAFPKTFISLLSYYERELGIGPRGDEAEDPEEDEEERETTKRMKSA
jgi:hypothetical protein